MPFVPQSILDEIRDRISIASYIGERIPLKKAGRNFKGACPFHTEKTPSFMVSDEKQIYHCFGCGEGGNIFGFVMKYDGVTFPEAVEQLASRAGVILPKKHVSREELDEIHEAAEKKKLLLKINKLVAQFFRQALVSGPKGAPASNYLKSRVIFDDISTQHFLGYADDSWEALTGYLKSKNVPLKLAEELGLVRKREGSDGYYDFFRNRLIFPIVSEHSEVIGFGGRDISGGGLDAPKYMNSPDSTIYHKSHSVYALNVASKSIRQQDSVIIVEGYMDVLALNQKGIMNVVAPLGTALTSGHLRLLMRYSKNMTLLFDGDAAGANAAARSIPTFLEAALIPKVIVLPDGNDPDDWIKEHGKEEFDGLVRDAEPLLVWYIRKRSRACGSDLSKKMRVVSELRPLFRRIRDAVEFGFYRKLVADELAIDESDLVRQLEYSGGSDTGANPPAEGMTGRLKTERLLLALLLEYPDFIRRVADAVDPSCFSDGSYRTLYELFVEKGTDHRLSAGRLIDMVGDEEVISTVHSLSVLEDVCEENAMDVLNDCLKYLARCKLSERLKVITSEIREAEKSGNDEMVFKLMEEKNRLISAA